MWNASDGKAIPPNVAPQVQLAGPVMDVMWSDRHHLLACCALDDQAPPMLIFLGEDRNYVPPRVVVDDEPDRPAAARELPTHLVPLKDAPREDLAIVPAGLGSSVETNQRWVAQWLNDERNQRSALSSEEKRQMKENILTNLFHQKDAQQHFPGGGALPGGL